jgi:glycosyltransferase involved in cell wall biosynthesis
VGLLQNPGGACREGRGLKLLHVPFCFHPDPVGGTEIYVQNLAEAQSRRGAEVAIAAPGPANQQYAVDGLEVYRFEQDAQISLRELYGDGDPTAAAAFERVLEATRPDLVHLHALTPGVSLRMARVVKRAGLPVVFTYHTPTVSCQRGTLLRWGTELCHGRLDVRQCTACSLESQGLKRGVAGMVSRIPPAAGRTIGNTGLSGGLWTVLRMTELLTLRQQSFRHFMEEVDQVISLCSWSTDVLLENGVPRKKILLCRHGLPLSEASANSARNFRPPQVPCRIVFLGRVSPVKGLDVLIRAITADSDLPVTLDIYGVIQGPNAYKKQLQKLCDPRIRFRDPISAQRIIEELSHYDVLAAPSQWLETGPLVVLEAFAAGIPVVGSDLGGIRELVRHEIDGILVEPGSVTAWAAALRRLTGEPGLLTRLRHGVKPPRTMEAVATDMLSLYEHLLSRTPRPVLSGSC